jgi:hypothetical protein
MSDRSDGEGRDHDAAGGRPDDPGAALAEAAGHFQDVLLAMVAAARSALDVVERFATDPAPLLDAAARWIPTSPADGSSEEAAAPPAEEPTRRPRVEHIRVEPTDG